MRDLKYAILFLAVLVYACKSEKAKITPTDCVENILKKDDSLGTVRNHSCKEISLSKTITQYTSSLNRLDFSTCPEKFTTAFKLHITAWGEMIAVTNNHESLRGEMHDLFDKIETSSDSVIFKEKLKAIWDTWDEIEKSKV